MPTHMTRRAFGAGVTGAVAAAIAGTALPGPGLALPSLQASDPSRRLRAAIDGMITASREHADIELLYDDPDYRVFGPWPWRQSYERVLDAHEVLCAAITDDTPTQRSILAWSHRIVPPVCRQAEQFWQPVEGLSAEFAGYQRDIHGARRRYALIKSAMTGSAKRDAAGDVCAARTNVLTGNYLSILGEWCDLRRQVLGQWEQTPADHELVRRIAQTYFNADAFDAAYLNKNMGIRYDGIDWVETRSCPLPCRDCDRLFGRVAGWHESPVSVQWRVAERIGAMTRDEAHKALAARSHRSLS